MFSRLKYNRIALYINALPYAPYFRQCFAPFIRHRRRSQDYHRTVFLTVIPQGHFLASLRRSPSALIPYLSYKKETNLFRLVSLAGAEGLEPSARGFGDRCSTNWAIPLYLFYFQDKMYYIKLRIICQGFFENLIFILYLNQNTK